jgi:hypothetical protein
VAVSTLVALSKDQVKIEEYERSISLIWQYQDRPKCLSRVSISRRRHFHEIACASSQIKR